MPIATALLKSDNLSILRNIATNVLAHEAKALKLPKTSGRPPENASADSADAVAAPDRFLSWTFGTENTAASPAYWSWRLGLTNSRVRTNVHIPAVIFEKYETHRADSEAATGPPLVGVAVPLQKLSLALTAQQYEARVQVTLTGVIAEDGEPVDSIVQIQGVNSDPSVFRFTTGLGTLIDHLAGETWPEAVPASLFDIRRQSPHLQVNPEVLYSVATEMIGFASDGCLIWSLFPFSPATPNDPLLQWTLRRGNTTGSWDFLAEGLLPRGTSLQNVSTARLEQVLLMPTELTLCFDLRVIYPVLLTLKVPPAACELVFPPDGNLLMCLAYARENSVTQSEIVTVSHLVATIKNINDYIPAPSPTASVRRLSGHSPSV